MNHINTDLREFSRGTLNDKIFQLNAPYKNPYQGQSPRWLFVCSAGLLRSPTAAAVAIKHGINARACGSNPNYALVPLSVNLIMWAEKIFFVNEQNFDQAVQNFRSAGYDDDIREKAVVWDIPDVYSYGDPELVELITQKLFP